MPEETPPSDLPPEPSELGADDVGPSGAADLDDGVMDDLDLDLDPPKRKRWPKGTMLECGCGEYVGIPLQVVPHRLNSKNPGCRNDPRVLSPDEIAPARRLAAERRAVRAAEAAAEPTPAPSLSGFKGAKGPGTRVAGSVRVVASEAGKPVEPPLFPYTISLPPESWSIYNFFCADPEYAFEGTFDEFVAQVLAAFPETLGFVGIRMVRQETEPVYLGPPPGGMDREDEDSFDDMAAVL